jgi:hypothetical protein
MRIAVFDHRVLRTNPVGSCHRALLQALCHGHDFTVFAVQFDNPCPERINRVRVRVVPRRCCSCLPPGGTAQLPAPARMAREFLRPGPGGREQLGVRRPVVRPLLLRRVPAEGDGQAQDRARLALLARPSPPRHGPSPGGRPRQDATVGGLRPPGGTLQPRPRRRRHRLRRARALRAQGFPLLLEALRQLDNACFKLVVIGGQPNLVKAYPATAAKLAVAGQVAFVGHAGRRPAVPLGRRHLRAPVGVRSRPAGCPGGGGPPASHCSRPSWTACGTCWRMGRPATSWIASASAWRPACGGSAACRRAGASRWQRRHGAAAQLYGLDAFVAGWAKLYAGLEA